MFRLQWCFDSVEFVDASTVISFFLLLLFCSSFRLRCVPNGAHTPLLVWKLSRHLVERLCDGNFVQYRWHWHHQNLITYRISKRENMIFLYASVCRQRHWCCSAICLTSFPQSFSIHHCRHLHRRRHSRHRPRRRLRCCYRHLRQELIRLLMCNSIHFANYFPFFINISADFVICNVGWVVH